jgi:putative ATPase
MPVHPLADRMRPLNLNGFVGQSHLLGKSAILRRSIESGTIPSMIFWGPPGVGKTTLARIISQRIKKPFESLSAISSGVKDLREVIAKARFGSGVVLFIDEIHRFNKSQQDSLLGAVENGTVILIGATTENPSFEVNSALLSRCQVYIMKELEEKDLREIGNRAIKEDEILSKKTIKIKSWKDLHSFSGGDARKLLNLIELSVEYIGKGEILIDKKLLETVSLERRMYFDKKGDGHYDIASAFIKSMRGSDPDATVYYLARMIEGGEDVKFIARRMVILAAEDIGLANPTALVLANSCFEAVNKVGMPESRIILSECAIYLAVSEKSNSAYAAIEKALKTAKTTGNLPIPLHLRNAPTKLMRSLDYGKDYKYSHSYEGNFEKQQYLPDEISKEKFYKTGDNSREKEINKVQQRRWGSEK